MAYKDKDKQKEANRLANKRYRDKQGITGITQKGITEQGITELSGNAPESRTLDGRARKRTEVPGELTPAEQGMEDMGFTRCVDPPTRLPTNFGQPDCDCMQCQINRKQGDKHTINHEGWKSASQLATNELNRVSLPGDVDYKGVALSMMEIGS